MTEMKITEWRSLAYLIFILSQSADWDFLGGEASFQLVFWWIGDESVRCIRYANFDVDEPNFTENATSALLVWSSMYICMNTR